MGLDAGADHSHGPHPAVPARRSQLRDRQDRRPRSRRGGHHRCGSVHHQIQVCHRGVRHPSRAGGVRGNRELAQGGTRCGLPQVPQGQWVPARGTGPVGEHALQTGLPGVELHVHCLGYQRCPLAHPLHPRHSQVPVAQDQHRGCAVAGLRLSQGSRAGLAAVLWPCLGAVDQGSGLGARSHAGDLGCFSDTHYTWPQNRASGNPITRCDPCQAQKGPQVRQGSGRWPSPGLALASTVWFARPANSQVGLYLNRPIDERPRKAQFQ
mmetsp:Transcript_82890/g.146253  ORF Transcript_82890/g.146253 Transcript_82890/m.146253 type:complete len:266 (-) Transcript_82890:1354-2151(-)